MDNPFSQMFLSLLGVLFVLTTVMPVAAQDCSVAARGPSQKIEIGIHAAAIFAGTAEFVGLGGRLSRSFSTRFALDFGLDSRFGKNRLYFLQGRQTLVGHESGGIFATYGASGWFGEDQLTPPVLPTLGLGGQRAIARYAAIRFDGQLMLGVLPDSRPVTSRLSVGLSIPVRGGYGP
jgi:hypothetical protein